MQKLLKLLAVVSFFVTASMGSAFASGGTFSEDQKAAFVQAYLTVNQIQQEYRTQLDPEMSEEQMQAVATQANERIESSINEIDNMDTDTYRQILVALESNEELLNDIQGRLENL